MKENARQGYWNGGPAPYGYRTVTAGMRGNTVKKKLKIEPSEAIIVRKAFDYYLHGKGLRSIASTLNDMGLRYQKSRLFNSSLIHQILTRTTYTGHHYFNKMDSKTRQRRDPSEWVEMTSPVIIPQETFDIVQAMRKQRQPMNTPPRVVNGPTLLTGIAKCATCGGGMTLSTGKSGRLTATIPVTSARPKGPAHVKAAASPWNVWMIWLLGNLKKYSVTETT